MRMEGKTISQLSEIIHDNWNHLDSKDNVKLRLNRIFGRKKISTILRELKEYRETISTDQKKYLPSSTLVVVLGIIRRNLDCIDELQKELEKSNLIGPLYGGMYKLLCGNSPKIHIDIKWNDDTFKNKYEYLTRFDRYLYWEYIEIFKAGMLLHKVDEEKFEKLVIKDKNKLFLLNMVSGHMEVKPSERLINNLLRGNDLEQNIGFVFLVSPISFNINRIESIKNEKKMGIHFSRQEIHNIQNNIELHLQQLNIKLLQCEKRVRVSLIVNYILVNRRYPKIFHYWLMDFELQEELIMEIKESNKLRTLKEVQILLFMVAKTKRTSFNGGKLSKAKLYDGILDVIIQFVRSREGIYMWAREEQERFSFICGLLPTKQRNKLKNFLIKESNGLIYSKLDELIRFDMYLMDRTKKYIIDGMLANLEI